MKLLLDESLPRGLKREFSGHEVSTVPECGWAGKSNGELLKLAGQDFDVFVTADQGIQYQQNLAGFPIAVVTLAAPSNRLADLRALVPKVLASLDGLEPGQVVVIAA